MRECVSKRGNTLTTMTTRTGTARADRSAGRPPASPSPHAPAPIAIPSPSPWPAWLSQEPATTPKAETPKEAAPVPVEASEGARPPRRPSRLAEIAPGVFAAPRSGWTEDLATISTAEARAEIDWWDRHGMPVRPPAGVAWGDVRFDGKSLGEGWVRTKSDGGGDKAEKTKATGYLGGFDA